MRALRFGLPCVLALAGLLAGARPLRADPLPFSFVLEPDGAINGFAGDTVGWGYTLVNDTDTWLEISGLDAGSFEHGTADASVFDFPILAPHTTRTVAFGSAAGLFQLTWDADAPAGFTNSGVFVLSGNSWDGDPFDGGNFLEPALSQSAEYSATVLQRPAAAVPEPTTGLLAALGIAFAARRGRRRPRTRSA